MAAINNLLAPFLDVIRKKTEEKQGQTKFLKVFLSIVKRQNVLILLRARRSLDSAMSESSASRLKLSLKKQEETT